MHSLALCLAQVLFGHYSWILCSIFFVPRSPSRRFGASGEGVGLSPSSHVHECVSRVDISCVEMRQGCRFSWTTFGFDQAHPRPLSDVTPLAQEREAPGPENQKKSARIYTPDAFQRERCPRVRHMRGHAKEGRNRHLPQKLQNESRGP